MKTMRQVISELQAQGYQVTYYVRRDGGILIRSIDGQTYRGAHGNAAARKITGAKISEARIGQLKFATRARKVKKPTLDDEVASEWRRVKAKWNKVFKAKGGKPHPAGYFGWNRIKYSIEHYGKEEALRRIKEAEKYTTGLAYSKNVEYLSVYIKDVADKTDSKELLQLYKDLIQNAYSIREEWIIPAYQELYKINDGIPASEVAKNTRAILRL